MHLLCEKRIIAQAKPYLPTSKIHMLKKRKGLEERLVSVSTPPPTHTHTEGPRIEREWAYYRQGF